MVDRNESYDTVVKRRSTAITIFDNATEDNDIVDVSLNSRVIKRVVLTSNGTSIPIVLEPGENIVSVTAVNNGTLGPTTVGVSLTNPNDVIFGGVPFGGRLSPGESLSQTLGVPKIVVDGSETPLVAKHTIDAGRRILTLDRDDQVEVRIRRNENIARHRSKNGITPLGFDIDEVPPSSTLESRRFAGFSSRGVVLNDNRTAGNRYLEQISNYGGVRLEDDWNIDLTATAPVTSMTYPTRGTLHFVYGTNESQTINGRNVGNNLIYALAGDDGIIGTNFDDIVFGGDGNDVVLGRDGNDELLGEAGKDILLGDLGNDVLYGGPGVDTMFGGSGRDLFGIRLGEGADLIADFSDDDKIVLLSGLRFDQLRLDSINGGAINGQPVTFPDFPGPIDALIFGTRISRRSDGQVLAYVKDVLPLEIDGFSFTQESGSQLPSPEA